jgi:hypothetical protein
VSTWVTVARFNLMRPANYLVLPSILPFSFALGAVTARDSHLASGYLLTFFLYFALQGMQGIGQWLPFSLTLGVSRRSFYAGTALLGVTLALVSGLVLAGLQAIERATGGWGLSLRFFRVPYLLDGPWWATWLTSFVGLCALFAYGMWLGTVHHRWGMTGLLAFVAGQVIVVVAAARLVAAEHWHVLSDAAGSSAGLTALGLTGVVAVLTVALLAGGQATIRRASV